MKKAIIIDDESRARQLLASMIKEASEEIEVVELCADLPSGVKAICKHKPDLVFLDIEMPGHSGLELFDFFNEDEINFSVIFATAYSEYAIDALRLSALDYILKPIQTDKLQTAIARFLNKKGKETNQLLALKENLQADVPNKIILPSGSNQYIYNINDIIYIKGEGAYSEFSLKDGNTLLVSKNLKYYEDTLEQHAQFLRAHRSYIVNVNYVKNHDKSEGGKLILMNEINIPISSEKVDEFLLKINVIR